MLQIMANRAFIAANVASAVLALINLYWALWIFGCIDWLVEFHQGPTPDWHVFLFFGVAAVRVVLRLPSVAARAFSIQDSGLPQFDVAIFADHLAEVLNIAVFGLQPGVLLTDDPDGGTRRQTLLYQTYLEFAAFLALIGLVFSVGPCLVVRRALNGEKLKIK